MRNFQPVTLSLLAACTCFTNSLVSPIALTDRKQTSTRTGRSSFAHRKVSFLAFIQPSKTSRVSSPIESDVSLRLRGAYAFIAGNPRQAVRHE